MSNRALRIYPALAVCVVFTVILGLSLPPICTLLSATSCYPTSSRTPRYFLESKRGYRLFEGSPFPEALNGSLWSLPYEVKMYVVLVLCLAATRYNLAVPIIVFAGAAVMTGVGILPTLPEVSYWIAFSTLFLAGSVVAAAQVFVGLPLAISALVVVAMLFAGLGEHVLTWELLLTAIVIIIGCLRLPKWLRPPLDLSYGIISMHSRYSSSARCYSLIFGSHWRSRQSLLFRWRSCPHCSLSGMA